MTKTIAKEKAWKAFSKYIRVRDAYATTGFDEMCECVTCYKLFPVTGKGCIQAGHFIPGRNNGILFDERGVHGQCYGCNGFGRGKQPRYHEYMLRKYGQEVIDDLFEKARSTVQYKTHDYLEIEKEYKQKLKNIRKGA